jgi:hypothetical protein
MESTSSQPTAKKEKKVLGRMWKKVKAAFKDKEITPATTSGTTQTTPTPKPKEEASKA